MLSEKKGDTAMLIEKYRNIFDNPDEWKYYNELHFPDNPFDDETVRKTFIRDYFKTGRKDNILDEKISVDELRDIHSISTFFLGILLKPICKKQELERLAPDFRYLWFITCLYHDYGYFIENEKSKHLPQKTSLGKLLSILGIKHNLLNTKIDLLGASVQQPKQAIYPVETIRKYYDFCRRKYCFINHGIVGGLLLYDKLIKNFKENLKEALISNPNLNPNSFFHKGLHWSTSHKDFYKFAAISIISHNIWLAHKADSKKIYKDNGLDCLIIDDQDQRISCEANPLMFLLLLADTIEPIKFFFQYKHSCILEKLNIEINTENEIIISVIDNCLQFKSWFDKIKDLENWTKVSVIEADKTLTIKIE